MYLNDLPISCHDLLDGPSGLSCVAPSTTHLLELNHLDSCASRGSPCLSLVHDESPAKTVTVVILNLNSIHLFQL